MDITTKADIKKLIGKTITGVELNPFETGRPDKPLSYGPQIMLDDGSILQFSVDETESAEYGITMSRWMR